MREFRDPTDVHRPAAAYSHQVELRDVRMLMSSGQIGMTTGGTLPTDQYDQLAVAFTNVRRNLEAAQMAASLGAPEVNVEVEVTAAR